MKILERIMLVDDDHTTNFYNEIMLKQNNVSKDIIIFQSGKEALEYLDTGNEKVDLILLDINMPIMNGWQFLEQFNQLDEKKREAIIIVMLTSSINSDDRKRTEAFQSVKKFINKPLNKHSINEVLEVFE
ncbi:response regulator [Pseudofulvibacter geojedonensis]|uniref:Response regulator n=1 Tax=Pseudofulvibacter geojedonensis TaxID=1123758 RepID=A0ABW3I2Y8_9FLAO